MKKIILLSFIFISFYSLSQTITKTPVVKTPRPFVLTAKDSIICQDWKLRSAEVFGVSKEPNEQQKNDALSFHYDQTASFTIEGKAYTGKWVTDRAKTVITVTTESGIEYLKIKKLDRSEITITHQDKDLITTTYNYAPVK